MTQSNENPSVVREKDHVDKTEDNTSTLNSAEQLINNDDDDDDEDCIKKEIEKASAPVQHRQASLMKRSLQWVKSRISLIPEESENDSEEEEFDMNNYEEFLKTHFESYYFLSGNQFDLIKSYFDELSQERDGISTEIVENHLISLMDKKPMVKASEDDIRTAVNLVDSDADGEICFIEFIDFLSLFFANKDNLETRIIAVLNGHDETHKKSAKLNQGEANYYFGFLKEFFQVKSQSNENKFRKNYDHEITFNKELKYNEFAEMVYPYLKDNVYVKW